MGDIKCPKCGTPITVKVYTVKTGANLPQHSTPERTLEDVRSLFPDGLLALLTFSEVDGRVHVKPKKYLGSQAFRTVAAIIGDAGGEYVSAGKDSHFVV